MSTLFKLRFLSCLAVASVAQAVLSGGSLQAQDAAAPAPAPAPPKTDGEPADTPSTPPVESPPPGPEVVPVESLPNEPLEAEATTEAGQVPAAVAPSPPPSSEGPAPNVVVAPPPPDNPEPSTEISEAEVPLHSTLGAGEPKTEEPARADFNLDGIERSERNLLFHVGNYQVRASGYLQAQYQDFKDSQNELAADGRHLLNASGFALARARAIIEGRNEWSSLALEYDVANVMNNGTGLQRAEATLHYLDKKRDAPFVAATLGMFRIPFGFSAPRSARVRLWMENPTVTRAFFPGQSDTGVRLEGSYAWFRYAVAYMNGNPIGEPRFGGFNPIKQGDLLGRLGVHAQAGWLRIIAGASLLTGRGFSPGAPATKDSISVSDITESGAVVNHSITINPGQAAVASQTFKRWGAGADVELTADPSRYLRIALRGEFMFGNNLDRAIFIADPVRSITAGGTGFDQRSYGAVGAFEALIYQLGWLGVRYDVYQPNPDHTDRTGGRVVSFASEITTTSFLAGFQMPGTLTRLLAEYDHVQDHLGLSVAGAPVDLRNDRFTLRLQVSL